MKVVFLHGTNEPFQLVQQPGPARRAQDIQTNVGAAARLLGRSVVTDTAAVKNCIGVSPQETAVAPNLTARENLLPVSYTHLFRLSSA